MKRQVAYFLSHPIQYFSPLLQAMASEMDLTVYYLSDASVRGNIDKGFGRSVIWDTPLLEGYKFTFIKNYSWRKSLNNRFADLINPGVFSAVISDKASIVIVNGWSYSSIIFVIIFSKIRGKKVWLRAENPLNQELKRKKWIIILKKIVLQGFLFKFIDKFLFIGLENENFFKFYGAKPAEMIFTPYAVDNLQFQSQHQRIEYSKVDLKKAKGISDNGKVVLYVGKYINKKRPLDLLKAFQNINNSAVHLIMVGEGELRGEMEKFIGDNHLKNVQLTGFINQSKIANYYALADVFVMCSGSGETWGLAVNEAMNFQLPVIISETCGSASDLIINGKNGFIVPEGDIPKLTDALSLVLDNESFRIQAGKESFKIIDRYSIDRIVSNLKQALLSE